MSRKFEPVQDIISPYAKSKLNNDFKYLFENLNIQGKTMQDLVAKGQLTPSQYEQLISLVNGNLKSGDITMYDLNKNGFNLDGTWFSSDFLRELNDGVINTTELLQGSVTTDKIADKSVTLDKILDTVTSKNLFNKHGIQDESYIDKANGNITNSSFYNTYEFDVIEGQDYAFSNFRIIAHYNSDGSFISAHDTMSSDKNFYTDSAKGTKIKVAVHDFVLDTAQIEKGSTQTYYEEHKLISSKALEPSKAIQRQLEMNENYNVFTRQKKGNISIKNQDILHAFKSLQLTGFDPNEKLKVGFISRNNATHGYKINIHAKRNGSWVRTFETGDMNVTENIGGFTEVSANYQGKTLSALIDYSLIPDKYGNYIEGEGTVDGEYHDPIMIIKPEIYTGNGINLHTTDPINPPVGYMWILV